MRAALLDESQRSSYRGPRMSVYQDALDSVDHFIKVASDISKVRLLTDPQYKEEIAGSLYEICQRLLDANGNMVRWLNRFLFFDFHGKNSSERFGDLAREYNDAKATSELHEMKFRCGDIRIIYERDIKGRTDDLFAGDQAAGDEARDAFTELGRADNSMVQFIHDEIVDNIDAFIEDVQHAHNLNLAERRRLVFNVTSSDLSKRLVRFATELSDLVLQYATIAGRPVTLTKDP
jgi:hypothetical protein